MRGGRRGVQRPGRYYFCVCECVSPLSLPPLDIKTIMEEKGLRSNTQEKMLKQFTAEKDGREKC